MAKIKGELMINETAKKLIEEYSKTAALGWSSDMAADIEAYIEEKVMVSPIEQIFFATWAHACQGKDDVSLLPQQRVGKYQIDFEADLIGHFANHEFPFSKKHYELLNDRLPKIAIELDGHEWHEKSKEQVERDKKRERFIVSQGFKVYRFSGREVFRRPMDCVLEVREQVRTAIRLMKRKIWGSPWSVA